MQWVSKSFGKPYKLVAIASGLEGRFRVDTRYIILGISKCGGKFNRRLFSENEKIHPYDHSGVEASG